MKNNFGLCDMLFEVETVMSNIKDEEPTPFIQLTPLEGDMVGTRFLIGEFRLIDSDDDMGQVQFSVSFPDFDEKEADNLAQKYLETLTKIVTTMMEDCKNENI